MPTLIFDFDSTLISCESLEEMLRPKLEENPKKWEELQQITREAMAGRLAFRKALLRRLQIAAPTRQEVEAFAKCVPQFFTKGMASLIEELRKAEVSLWVISGGLRLALVPACCQLGIFEENICAVEPIWASDGSFRALSQEDLFADSKVAGARGLVSSWSSPVVAVGDGMTDYALFEQGLVQHFIIYTEHVQRAAVLATGAPCANNVSELRAILQGYFSNEALLSKRKD